MWAKGQKQLFAPGCKRKYPSWLSEEFNFGEPYIWLTPLSNSHPALPTFFCSAALTFVWQLECLWDSGGDRSDVCSACLLSPAQRHSCEPSGSACLKWESTAGNGSTPPATQTHYESTCVKAHYNIGHLHRLQRRPCVKPTCNRESALMATIGFGEVTVTFDHPVLISSSLSSSGCLCLQWFSQIMHSQEWDRQTTRIMSATAIAGREAYRQSLSTPSGQCICIWLTKPWYSNILYIT